MQDLFVLTDNATLVLVNEPVVFIRMAYNNKFEYVTAEEDSINLIKELGKLSKKDLDKLYQDENGLEKFLERRSYPHSTLGKETIRKIMDALDEAYNH